MLTEKDLKLIEEANKISYTRWDLINEDKADTPEGREELHRIKMRKYHTEEYYAGLD